MELAERIARLGSISVTRARELEKQLTRILAEGLAAEGEVRINGFGVLRIEERKSKAWDPVRRKRTRRKRRRIVKWKPAAAGWKKRERTKGQK